MRRHGSIRVSGRGVGCEVDRFRTARPRPFLSKMRFSIDRSGWSRIRTCEGIATRFTVWPLWPLGYPPVSDERPPSRRLSAISCPLRDRGHSRHGRAGGESRTHNRRFTKPVLCRLSYASDLEAVKLPNIPAKCPIARTFPCRGRKSPSPPTRSRRDGRMAAAAQTTGPSRVESRGPSIVSSSASNRQGGVGPFVPGRAAAGLRAWAGRASPRWRSCGACPGRGTRSGGPAPW